MLKPLGFAVERPVFSEHGTPDVENLYARRSGNGPHLMFAGHTDVVPPGDEAAWTHPPFAAEIREGEMYGRGAVDMKGGIACFVAAVARHIETNGRPRGLGLAADHRRRGGAVDQRHRQAARTGRPSKGERWDAALVGEPTNPERLGDMIKIGRRGSLSGVVTVSGRQGHAAYPHLADNPVRGAVTLADALLDAALRRGHRGFPADQSGDHLDRRRQPGDERHSGDGDRSPSTSASTTAGRPRRMQAEIHNRLDRASRRKTYRAAEREPIDFELGWRDRPSHVFLTRDERADRDAEPARSRP